MMQEHDVLLFFIDPFRVFVCVCVTVLCLQIYFYNRWQRNDICSVYILYTVRSYIYVKLWMKHKTRRPSGQKAL